MDEYFIKKNQTTPHKHQLKILRRSITRTRPKFLSILQAQYPITRPKEARRVPNPILNLKTAGVATTSKKAREPGPYHVFTCAGRLNGEVEDRITGDGG